MSTEPVKHCTWTDVLSVAEMEKFADACDAVVGRMADLSPSVLLSTSTEHSRLGFAAHAGRLSIADDLRIAIKLEKSRPKDVIAKIG